MQPRILGNFQEAIQYHRKPLFIAKEMGNAAGETEAYANLGNTFQSLRNFQEAIKYHKKRLSIAKKLSDKLGDGRDYMNLGNTYISLGKLEEAKKNYEKRQTIAIEVSDKAGEGRALGSLGNVEQELGDFKKASITTTSTWQLRKPPATNTVKVGATAISAKLTKAFKILKKPSAVTRKHYLSPERLVTGS